MGRQVESNFGNADDCEAQADRLLKECGAHKGEYPAIPEALLLRRDKEREEVSLEQAYYQSSRGIRQIPQGIGLNEIDPVLAAYRWSVIFEAIDEIVLDVTDNTIICGAIFGYTTREIAKLVGFESHTTVIEHMAPTIAMLRRKLPNTQQYWIWEVLIEVFRVRGVRMAK